MMGGGALAPPWWGWCGRLRRPGGGCADVSAILLDGHRWILPLRCPGGDCIMSAAFAGREGDASLQGEKGRSVHPAPHHPRPYSVGILSGGFCLSKLIRLTYHLLSQRLIKSHRMSSTSSIPMESRIKSGVTPPANWSSSDNCWCVVLAG